MIWVGVLLFGFTPEFSYSSYQLISVKLKGAQFSPCSPVAFTVYKPPRPLFNEILPASRPQPKYPPEVFLDQCQDVPTGYGIPGFRPGIHKEEILQMFGAPSGTEVGYWPNTQAMFYHLIPNQVSVGFLFDNQSGKLRQTEVSFAQEVDLDVILLTLNSMSGCRLSSDLKQGLHYVRSRQLERFTFGVDSLKGVIQREQGDRIYIGIWEADLH